MSLYTPTLERDTNIAEKELIGVNVFVEWEGDVQGLVDRLQGVEAGLFRLSDIYKDDIQMWPVVANDKSPQDGLWCCHFADGRDTVNLTTREIAYLLGRLYFNNVEVVKTENVYVMY